MHDIVLKDRRLKVSEIVKPVGISDERVHHILTEELGMKKLSARWVPRLLTSDQKRMRMQASQECLDRFKKNPKNCIRIFVITDETCVHYFTLETKQQLKQWMRSDSPPAKSVKINFVRWKVYGSIFLG